MGTQVPAARNMIYIQGSQFRNAISEDLLQRFGASINFINTYQYYPFYFGLLGPYGGATLSLPYLGAGTQEIFEYDSEIMQIWVYSGTAGTGGPTTLDIKKAAAGSSSYSSIFSTLPSVANTAASGVVFDMNGDVILPTGCTRPVLSTANFNAGDKLRLDITSKMTESAADIQIQIFWRPR